MTIHTGEQESPQTSIPRPEPHLSVKSAPPPETPAAVQTRFRVIAAFWAVIIFLGFPIWWKTTSIYRASLPIEEMVDWADGKVWLAQLPFVVAGLLDANNCFDRHVDQYSLWTYILRHLRCSCSRPSISSAPHSILSMISTSSQPIISDSGWPTTACPTTERLTPAPTCPGGWRILH